MRRDTGPESFLNIRKMDTQEYTKEIGQNCVVDINIAKYACLKMPISTVLTSRAVMNQSGRVCFAQ